MVRPWKSTGSITINQSKQSPEGGLSAEELRNADVQRDVAKKQRRYKSDARHG